jgi:dTDP-4-dehydrorhamnose 3,5-epimerase/CDP-3, 6-dideoxy-D-glycero-D-glycero-4-hexulose-5-epimerase
MNFENLGIEECYLVKNFVSHDIRGTFVKTFHEEEFRNAGLQTEFKESYYSLSKKNVIRGMHFQTPPSAHDKLVYVTYGSILDVVLDIRKDSATYGKSISVQLNALNDSIYIPKGCAHGFLTLSDEALVVYNVSSVYNPSADRGLLWNSFDFDWEITDPIISDRDSAFESFTAFNSPFQI